MRSKIKEMERVIMLVESMTVHLSTIPGRTETSVRPGSNTTPNKPDEISLSSLVHG